MVQTSTDATCLAGDASTTAFNQYMLKCRNNINKNDDANANTFLTETIDKYKGIFETYRAQYTDLMTVTDNLKATVGNTSSLNDQISNLESQKIKIREEINKYRTLSGASDRMFLEDIYNGTPNMKIAPTLQDSVLLLFWFSWLLMSIVLVMVRWMSPDGSWKSALFVFVLLMLVTLCMFAIISYAA